jgi:hypothetical protein
LLLLIRRIRSTARYTVGARGGRRQTRPLATGCPPLRERVVMDKGKREGGATAISLTDAAATTDSFRIWEFKVSTREQDGVSDVRPAVEEGRPSGKRVEPGAGR